MSQTRSNPFKPVWGLFAILLALVAIKVIAQLNAPKDKIPWRTDLAAATIESKRDGKPVLLYFTAQWCGPCQVMKRETWSSDDVASKLRAYVPVKLDLDFDQALAERYQVESVPTLLLLDADGNVTRSALRRLTAEEFLEWISAS